MSANTSLSVTTAPAEHFSSSADHALVVAYIICLIVGVPGNILALRYFRRQQPALSICLFSMTAVLDLVGIPVICLPTIHVLVHDRAAGWYQDTAVCTVLGMLFQVISEFSVFLLAVLSFSRTYLLIFPLRRQSKLATFKGMGVYAVLVLAHETVYTAFSRFSFKYTLDEGYCWDKGISPGWDQYDNVVDVFLLAIPIIPVTISCTITCYKIYASGRATHHKMCRVKRNATITILLYTLVYLTLSMPNFLNYIVWAQSKIRFGSSAPYYSATFMKYYSWLLTDTLLIVMVSTINPLILLGRVKKYHIELSSHRTPNLVNELRK